MEYTEQISEFCDLMTGKKDTTEIAEAEEKIEGIEEGRVICHANVPAVFLGRRVRLIDGMSAAD
jgi:hypothetical protein